MKLAEGASYNERLFGTGVRGTVHLSRFRALTRVLRKLRVAPARVVELGCYDGKTIRFLPSPPARYVGLDANWEHGLEIGRSAWREHPEYSFLECTSPDHIPNDERFDLAVCMETLEHVPPSLVDPFLAKLAAITHGWAFITVPNEKGPVFAVKFLLKKLLIGDAPNYSAREFWSALAGRMDAVQRDEHKGFDYDEIVRAVARHFDVVRVQPYPLSWLHRALGFGVVIVARSRVAARAASTAEDPGDAAAVAGASSSS